MAYTPTVWQGKPSTATPITAANLNKLEAGLVAASEAADEAIAILETGAVPEAFTSALLAEGSPVGEAISAAAETGGEAPVTRRAVQTFGSAGTNGTANVSNVCVRIPVRFPVLTTRWRLRLRAYNVRQNSAGSGGHFFRGAWVGPHLSFGNFSATPTVAIPDPGATAVPVPSSADPFVSEWVTTPEAQLGSVFEEMLSVQITGPTASVPRGYNGAFGSWGTGDGGLQTVSTSAWAFTPWDISVEYEFVSTDKASKVGVYIGDSNTEGLGGGAGTGFLQWQKFVHLHAKLSNAVGINLGVSGIEAANFGTSGYRWDRIPWADIAPDYAVVGLGTNDANANTNRSLEDFQTAIRGIWSQARSRGVKEIYAVLPAPRTSFTQTALTSAVSVGATSIQTAAPFSNGDYIALDVPGSSREVVRASATSTGSGPYTTTLAAATTIAHASGAVAKHNGQDLLDQYRTWLASGPDGVIPLDADIPLRDSARPWAISPELTTDGTHFTHRGAATLAKSIALPNN